MIAAITTHRRTIEISEMGAMKGSSSWTVNQNSIAVMTMLMPMSRGKFWFGWPASWWFLLLDMVVNSPPLRDMFAIMWGKIFRVLSAVAAGIFATFFVAAGTAFRRVDQRHERTGRVASGLPVDVVVGVELLGTFIFLGWHGSFLGSVLLMLRF